MSGVSNATPTVASALALEGLGLEPRPATAPNCALHECNARFPIQPRNVNSLPPKRDKEIMKSTILLAAVSGIVMGVGGIAHAETRTTGTAVDAASGSQQLDADAGAKHACKGHNACKGQGGCKTDKNGCKGQNACKGQGGCRTDGGKKPDAK